MQNRNRRKMSFPVFPFILLAAALLMGAAVMLLWNAIVSPVLQVGQLNYWQSVGLLALCRILSGGFGGRPSASARRQWRNGSPWRQKWMNMSPEEKAKFKEEWKKRCGPRNADNQE